MLAKKTPDTVSDLVETLDSLGVFAVMPVSEVDYDMTVEELLVLLVEVKAIDEKDRWDILNRSTNQHLPLLVSLLAKYGTLPIGHGCLGEEAYQHLLPF